MTPFTSLTAVAAPFYSPDIDTDRIIPQRFLRKPLSAGYRNFLFFDERFTGDGRENPDFVLHREPYRDARILIGGRNFGCGSSREGAVYALLDFGFRAVIAPSFGDTFRANCFQNGIVPLTLPESIVEDLNGQIERSPGVPLSIDLRIQTITAPDGRTHHFEIDSSRKAQLLQGLDDVGITLKHLDSIEEFEAKHRRRMFLD